MGCCDGFSVELKRWWCRWWRGTLDNGETGVFPCSAVGSSKKTKAVAVEDFVGRDILSFGAKQVVNVLDARAESWWAGYLPDTGEMGFFPAGYVMLGRSR